MIHKIARTYSRLPHEVLALSPFELSLARECVRAAEAERAAMVTRMDGMIFPVFSVGEL